LPEEELAAFIEEAKDAADAVSAIDLDKLAESIKNIGSLIKKLQIDDPKRSFSSEEYNSIIE
jgi:hypothetical protein